MKFDTTGMIIFFVGLLGLGFTAGGVEQMPADAGFLDWLFIAVFGLLSVSVCQLGISFMQEK